MCIALRTMVVLPGDSTGGAKSADSVGEAGGGWAVHIQAGGGIVADSVAEDEHQETVNKAAALAKAVSVAEVMFTPHTDPPTPH